MRFIMSSCKNKRRYVYDDDDVLHRVGAFRTGYYSD